MTQNQPNNGQIRTPYLHILALATLYLTIRLIGGQPEDTMATVLFAGALLKVRL